MKNEDRLSLKAISLWASGAWLLTAMQSFGKIAGHYGFAVRMIMAARYHGGLLLAVGYMWASRGSLQRIRSGNWRMQTQRSLAMSAVTFGLFSAARLIGLGLSTAFIYSWPAFSLVLGWQKRLGFDEKPDFRSVTSVGVTLLGVAMLAEARVQHAAMSSDIVTMALGIGAVMMAALCTGYQANIASKIKAIDPDPLTGVVWLMFIGAIAVGLWDVGTWIFPSHPHPQPVITAASMAAIVAVPICGTVAQFVWIQAQSTVSAKKLTPLTSVFQLPVALLVGRFVFDEPWPSFREAMWMAVILAGSLLNYLPMPTKPPTGPFGTD